MILNQKVGSVFGDKINMAIQENNIIKVLRLDCYLYKLVFIAYKEILLNKD